MMSTQLADTLGRLQARIYWLHDAEEFDELTNTASKIYQLLGYSESLSNQVGRFISEAYRISDDAQIARFAGDPEKELKYYSEVQLQLAEAVKLLNLPIETAEYQVQWWMLSRHKKIIAALSYILKQHKYSKLSVLGEAKLAYYSFQIGLGHHQRNLARCEKYAIHYWSLLLQSEEPIYPYIG
ncbi:hypothetical protein H6G00_02805 [Leptolyngbya sp. FACHB-541]|nr:hypothetical protein [Leptolyngbya sp. FACHB-541]